MAEIVTALIAGVACGVVLAELHPPPLARRAWWRATIQGLTVWWLGAAFSVGQVAAHWAAGDSVNLDVGAWHFFLWTVFSVGLGMSCYTWGRVHE